MSFVSRGFHRRHTEPGQEGRVPPGQYVTSDFPVLSAGPTPHRPLENWSVLDHGRDRRAAALELGRVPRAAERERSRRTSTASPSGRSSTRTGRASRSTRCSRASRRPAEFVVAFSDGGYTTNLPLEDVTGGKAWVAFGYDGEPLEPEHGGPARLLVPHLYFWKSAKWVRGLQSARGGRAGLLGGLRLPQLRRPMARAAVRGRLTWQLAEVVESIEETPRVTQPRAARPGVDRPPGGPARRRPADGRGRLPGAAQLLDRLGARGRSRSSLTVERLDDGEVSPYLVDELRAGDKLELRGPIGGYFVWDAAAGRSAAAGRRRLGHRAADGDPAPSRRPAAAMPRCGCWPRGARRTTSSTRPSSSGSGSSTASRSRTR